MHPTGALENCLVMSNLFILHPILRMIDTLESSHLAGILNTAHTHILLVSLILLIHIFIFYFLNGLAIRQRSRDLICIPLGKLCFHVVFEHFIH